MAKVNKTPAYVQKAIEWLKKNSPEGEDLAFINAEEAALLKSLGGSGKEVVDGVRSYSGGVNFDEIRREQQARQRDQFVDDLQQRFNQLQQETANRQIQPVPAIAPPYEAPGGAGELQKALGEISSLEQPTVPTAPTLQPASFNITDNQLIQDTERLRADPTLTTATTIDPTQEALRQAAVVRRPAERATAVSAGDTGQAVAATQAAPTQVIGDIQEAIPTEELAQAATEDLDPRATLQFQLAEITSSIQDGQPLPLWAAPAARNADAIMLQRGLGASSMAASARTQALLEAGLPIASADAEAYGRIQLQNLNNRQATALQNANNLAAMRTQNLNARMTAAVNNAQNFLTLDTASLSNRQAANTLTYNAFTQKLFADQAAENAASQFNATTENQVEQFFATLENSVNESNANRQTAIEQFNAGEVNSLNQFLENQRLNRESFNVQQSASIRAANANWYRSVATIDNANQMQSNAFAAQSALQLRQSEYQALLQRRRDDAHFIYEAFEREEDRKHAVAIAAQEAAINRSNNRSNQRSGIFDAVFDIGTRLLFGN